MTEPASDEMVNEIEEEANDNIDISPYITLTLIARIRQQDAEIERLRAEVRRANDSDKEVLARLLRIEAAMKGGEA